MSDAFLATLWISLALAAGVAVNLLAAAHAAGSI